MMVALLHAAAAFGHGAPRMAVRTTALSRVAPRHNRALLIQSRAFTDRPPSPPPADGVEASKKRHALLTFGFTGSGYFGLQSQSALGDPERPTVADAIRAALLKEGFIAESNFAPLTRTRWSLASRTDKGVHAACAAASCRLETLSDDVIEQPELEAAGDPAAIEHAAKLAAADDVDNAAARSSPPPPQPEWQLSASALSRINDALPDDVRLFSATRVRKRFDAREQASGRVYEYLLPLHAVGEQASASDAAEQLDAVLRTFEGSHRFHNFASGLRRGHDESGFFRGDVGEGGEEVTWPLALAPGAPTSAAYRSVVTCRVRRSLAIDGCEYLVLRIAGLSFVLHQIRHMVGAALAVTNGVVPLDAMTTALSTPLRIDVSPLVPGCGLLLDEVSWFSLKDGAYEARVPPVARDSMERFKEEVIYPHVHELYQQGACDRFLDELRNGSYTRHYDESDYARLRKANAAWQLEVRSRAEKKRAERALRRAERDSTGGAAEAGGADLGTFNKKLGRRVVETLPGGLYVEVCRRYQIMPGPAAQRAMEVLRAKAARGELRPAEHWDYYLEALEAEGLPDLPRVGAQPAAQAGPRGGLVSES